MCAKGLGARTTQVSKAQKPNGHGVIAFFPEDGVSIFPAGMGISTEISKLC